jgi:uncharacterized protein with PQ loop repeat
MLEVEGSFLGIIRRKNIRMITMYSTLCFIVARMAYLLYGTLGWG